MSADIADRQERAKRADSRALNERFFGKIARHLTCFAVPFISLRWVLCDAETPLEHEERRHWERCHRPAMIWFMQLDYRSPNFSGPTRVTGGGFHLPVRLPISGIKTHRQVKGPLRSREPIGWQRRRCSRAYPSQSSVFPESLR